MKNQRNHCFFLKETKTFWNTEHFFHLGKKKKKEERTCEYLIIFVRIEQEQKQKKIKLGEVVISKSNKPLPPRLTAKHYIRALGNIDRSEVVTIRILNASVDSVKSASCIIWVTDIVVWELCPSIG